MKAEKTIIFLILTVCSFIFISCANKDVIDNEELPDSNQVNTTPTLEKIDISIPDGWTVFPKPSAESHEMQCANRSRNEWKVESAGEKIRISKHSYEPNEQLEKLPENLRAVISKNRNTGKGLGGYLHIEPFKTGWLIGSDAGEWGGKLFWFNSDGSKKTELLNDNIRGIVKVGDKVFILSGMAHMDIDEGKLSEFQADEIPFIRLLTDFKTQPQSFVVEGNDSFLIAFNNKIVRVKTSGEVKTIKETNFNALYPNSMTVTSSGVIYIGMRLFIVRFVPFENNYREEWLVPQNCQKFAVKDFDCVCQNGK